jgi:DNA-binding MarR family transcriptional regulator
MPNSATTRASTREKNSQREALLDEATDHVLVVSRALVGVAARSLAAVESEITLRQYRALVVLAASGEQNVGSLAEVLEIHPSTATRLCDRLIAKGLIERTTSVESRREVTVRLSADGQGLVRTVSTRRRKEIRRILGQLEASVQRRIVQAFATFADAAGELPDHAWKLGWTT